MSVKHGIDSQELLIVYSAGYQSHPFYSLFMLSKETHECSLNLTIAIDFFSILCQVNINIINIKLFKRVYCAQEKVVERTADILPNPL